MSVVGTLLRSIPLAMVIALALPGAANAQGNPPAPPACSNGTGMPTCCCNGINCSTPCEGDACCPVCPCSGPFCPPTAPISVSVDDASVDEGNDNDPPASLTFPIRSSGNHRDIAVVVQTEPGTASEDSDYAPLACTVLFPLGTGGPDDSQGLSVTIFGDTQPEPDETLYLHLIRAIELVTPQFAQTTHAAGEDPYDVKIGDLNGDGAPDLVVANDVTNDVSVLLNQGDGTYAAAVHYPAGTCADSVVIGELNGDGKPDLAVAASCDSQIAVLLGDGDGAFAPAVFYPAGAYVVLLRDINGDSKPDLVALDSDNQRILALLNDGSGGFGAAETLVSLESGATGFDMADFNGDSRLDLAVSFASFAGPNKLSVMLASAGGGFEPTVDYAAGARPNFVAAGDLNVDGKPDLAVSNRSSDNVSVLLNNGGGSFAAAVNYAAAGDTQGLAIGDINGDGRPDVAVANQNGNNVSVLINRGGGTFANAVNIPAGGGAIAVAIGDLDGNGAADLAVANRDAFTASVLLAPAPVSVPIADSPGLGTIINDDAFDTTPDAFDFADFSGVPRGSTQTSAQVIITGINAPAPVSVSSGSYSVGCSGSFTTASGSIENGQSVCLRHVASGNYSTTITTTLTVGGVSGSFSSTTQGPPPPPPPPPPDTFPDAITFNSVTGVEPGSVQESNRVTVTGINAPTGIAVRGGEYRIFTSGVPGGYRTGETTVTNGQQVQVRHTASLMFSTPTHTDLFIGGRSGHFTSTTLAQDTAPDAFSFAPVAGVEPGVEVLSETITVSGINGPAAVSAEGGDYCIGTAPCGTGTTVEAGDAVRLRATSGGFGETVTATLTIGGVSAGFSVTTTEEPPPPDPNQGTIAPDGRSGAAPDSNDAPVGVELSDGMLVMLRRVPEPHELPSGFTYPNGFFEFQITGLAEGATVTVTLTLPEGASPNAYVKCDDRCTLFAGARFSGNVVTLTLTDGGAGDSDGLANGSISDPGAPAVRGIDTDTTARAGSSGGAPGLGLLLWLMIVSLPRLVPAARRGTPTRAPSAPGSSAP